MRIRSTRTFAFISSFILVLIAAISTGLVLSQSSIEGKAELHPNYLILEPASPIEQGRLVNITTILENTGDATANQFKVEFFIRTRSETETGSWTSFAVDEISGLASLEQEIEARAVLDTSLTMLIPNPNIYEIRVVVDSNDQIPEQDEDNNELITSIIIQDSQLGLSDLRATMMMFDPTSPVEQTTDVEVTGMISNNGDSTAPAFKVEFAHCLVVSTLDASTCSSEFTPFAIIEDPFLGGLAVGGELAARATVQKSLEDSSKLDPGTYLIRLSVDPSDAHHPAGSIEEQDEANNDLIVTLTILGPEFHITGMTFEPVLPRIGDNVSVAASVANTGQVKGSSVEVAFFVDGAQFDLKEITITGGQTEVVRGSLNTIQLGLNPGKHTIRVVVDPKNVFAERDETNNETRTALTLLTAIPDLPELRPKGLVLNPSSPIQLGISQSLNVLVEVLNTGVAIADDVTVEISYRSSGSRRWIPIPCATNCSVSQFEPGSRYITNADLFLLTLTPGSYEVRAVVDPNNEIAELDEFNNEIQSTFKLLAIRKPDLLIDPISVQFLPSLAERQGTPITISADVVNFGEADADAFDVTISLQRISGDSIGAPITVANIALDGLDIGGRFTIESTINTNLEPGFYQINIEVDPQDRIMELDELNNLFITGPLFIRGPDLTGFMRLVNPVSTGTIPQIGAGTDVELAVDVTNIGIEAAGEFTVDFCIQPVDANGLETGTCMPFGTPQTFSGIGIASSLEATAILNTSGLASGRYNVKALIDSNNQVQEENELNNQAIVTIDIVGGSTSNAGGPVTGVDLVIEKIDLNPPLAAIGQLVDVKARLVNIGTQNAGPFRAVFFYKRKGQTLMTNFHQTQITTLPAGQMIWLQATLSTSLLGLGEFEIIVIADFNNEISEPNEFNNRLSMDLEIF